MACFSLNKAETRVSIPSYSHFEGVEYYLIKVTCWHDKEWTVSQRYKSFVDLHTSLQKELALAKDELPAKKLIKDAKFLETRRHDLEGYLQKIMTIVHQLPVIPITLLKFLDFHKYDIVFLLQSMALEMSQNVIRNDSFTILELHAISERLRLPSFPLNDSAFDFSNILDHCSGLQSLTIVPAKGHFETKEEYLQQLISPFGTSNILPSTLNFELKPFTSVRSLSMIGIAPQNILKCDTVRSNIISLVVNFTRAQNVRQILLPEFIHDNSDSDSLSTTMLQEFSWPLIKLVDFSSNDIWTIDASLKLVPKAEEVNLSDNRLRTVTNLSSLHHLNTLNLSGNLIESVADWHFQLGNVESLNLSCNKIKSLKGLSRLRSLKCLDLSFNQIDGFDEVDELSKLPVIENVSLNGNPSLMQEVDYRARVLTRFEERCTEIILDNERCSQLEIDKALVFSALRKTKLS